MRGGPDVDDGEWLKLKLDGKDAYVMEIWKSEAGESMVLLVECDANGVLPKANKAEEAGPAAGIGSIADGDDVAAALHKVISERMTGLEELLAQKMDSMQQALLNRVNAIEELVLQGQAKK